MGGSSSSAALCVCRHRSTRGTRSAAAGAAPLAARRLVAGRCPGPSLRRELRGVHVDKPAGGRSASRPGRLFFLVLPVLLFVFTGTDTVTAAALRKPTIEARGSAGAPGPLPRRSRCACLVRPVQQCCVFSSTAARATPRLFYGGRAYEQSVPLCRHLCVATGHRAGRWSRHARCTYEYVGVSDTGVKAVVTVDCGLGYR